MGTQDRTPGQHLGHDLLLEHEVAVHRIRCYPRHLRVLKLKKSIMLCLPSLLVSRQSHSCQLAKLREEACKEWETRSKRVSQQFVQENLAVSLQ